PIIHYIHTDHLGTPQEVTDAEGRIEWSADYSAWGERQHSLPLDADEAAQIHTDCALRFQGQYFDAETGLHYNTLRCYNPGCGRFISPDPINIQGGLNLYQYAPNAANWIDPWGWSCFFRGAKKGEPVSFKAKPGEYRIDNKTGLVKDTHGVSVFDNPQSVMNKGFDPHKVDMSTVSGDLKIIQRGKDLHHYEIVPSKPMSLEAYQEALSKIKVFG
ncbi:MAG: RHS domain-containing protein, partial [Helicobacteraceae bacterium]|nr:RHS domain-containing protein [Helicobacteraceae bacterium]